MRGLKKHIARRIAGLHRDESGQSIVFIALTLLLMVVFVMLVINSGQSITGKVKMTNAADSSVISGATWMARGLNTAAIINKTEAYVLAILVLTESMNRTHQFTAFALAAQYATAAYLMTNPFTYIPGIILMAVTHAHYGIIFGSAFYPTTSGMKWAPKGYGGNYYSIDGLYANVLRKMRPPLWSLLKALSAANDKLTYVFPVVAQAEAIHMGIANEADVALLVPTIPQLNPTRESGCEDDRLCLPIVPAEEFSAICGPLREGEYNEGWGTYDFTRDVWNPTWTPTEEIYHFPETGINEGSVDYFHEYLPYYWTGIYYMFQYSPPFVVELHKLALEMQLDDICSGGSGDTTMEITIDQTPEQCYETEENGGDLPFIADYEKTYKYTAYRYLLQGNSLILSGDISDYYETWNADSQCSSADYMLEWEPTIHCCEQHNYCSASGVRTMGVDPEHLCRNIVVGTDPPKPEMADPSNPTKEEMEALEEYMRMAENGEVDELYGCECLKSPHSVDMAQDQHFLSGNPYKFGESIECSRYKSNNCIGSVGNFHGFDGSLGWIEVAGGGGPTGGAGRKPYWRLTKQWDCARNDPLNDSVCHDAAIETDPYRRDCCHYMACDDNGNCHQEYEDKKKCYYVDLVVLEGCQFKGMVQADDYLDYLKDQMGDINMGGGGSSGNCGTKNGPTSNNDNDPDKYGSACRELQQTGPSDSIRADNEDGMKVVRVQQLDWTPTIELKPVWAKHMKYFAGAYQFPREATKKLAKSRSFEAADQGIYAFGSALIYVPDGVPQNMFQQEWRVRLIPVQYGEEGVSTVAQHTKLIELANYVDSNGLSGLISALGDDFADGPLGFLDEDDPGLFDEEANEWLINH